MARALQLRRDYRLGVGILVGLNLTLAFGVIGLLVRLRPAIEGIFDANVVSVEAAEGMLESLADTRDLDASEPRAARFRAEWARAKAHVTQPEETPLLESISRNESAALDGDPEALASVVESIHELIGVNRSATRVADRRASRSATAGAWAAVFVAIVSFLASIVVFRRLARRLIEPLEELRAVLEASRAGNPHRRCRVFPGTHDVTALLSAVNDLLDRASQRIGGGLARDHRTMPNTLARSALVASLNARPQAVAVLDASGGLFAANDAALAYLSTGPGGEVRTRVQEAIGAAIGGSPLEIEHAQLAPLRDGIGWIVVFTPDDDPAAPAEDAAG